MRRHCQFTVKRPEKKVDLTVAEEQQPCGVQVVEWVGLTDHLETEWLLRPMASILTKKQRR
jgi:hypothetical protein